MSDADLQNTLAEAEFMLNAQTLGTSPVEAFSATRRTGRPRITLFGAK